MNKIKEKIAYVLIIGSTIISVLILFLIAGFVFIKGVPLINQDFLTNDFNEKWFYIEMTPDQYGAIEYAVDEDGNLIIQEDVSGVFQSRNGDSIEVEESDKIIGVNGMIPAEVPAGTLQGETIEVKVEKEGGGIWPMIVTTFLVIILSLAIALPLGIGTAIFLVEYGNERSRLYRFIHMSVDNLAGIPSIIFGLFGMIFFVTFLGLGFSILSAGLTLTIMLMPTIIRTTEEALKSVPNNLREASFGLGVGKSTTIFKIVLPSAMNGIVVAIILSVGRVIGESAILLFTAGTVANTPTSIHDSAATLTVQAYLFAKEDGNIAAACAIGVVIISMIIVLNILAKVLGNKLSYDLKG